jgi:hypothetical protein
MRLNLPAVFLSKVDGGFNKREGQLAPHRSAYFSPPHFFHLPSN